MIVVKENREINPNAVVYEFECKNCKSVLRAHECDPNLNWFSWSEFSFICPCCKGRTMIDTDHVKFVDIDNYEDEEA